MDGEGHAVPALVHRVEGRLVETDGVEQATEGLSQSDAKEHSKLKDDGRGYHVLVARLRESHAYSGRDLTDSSKLLTKIPKVSN